MGSYDGNWRSKSTVRAMVGFPELKAERISFAEEQAIIFGPSPSYKYKTISLNKKLPISNFSYTIEPKVKRYYQIKDKSRVENNTRLD